MKSSPNRALGATAMTEGDAQAWPARRLPAEWEPAGAVLLAWPRADGDWAPYLQDVRACYRRLLAALSALAPVLLLVDEPEQVLLELGPELAALTRQPFSPSGSASANSPCADRDAAQEPAPMAPPPPARAPASGALPAPRLRLLASPARDTWTRDYGPITVLEHHPEHTTRAVATTTTRAPASTPVTARAGSRQERPLLLDFAFNGWGGKYASGGDDAAAAALHASGALGSTPLRRLPLVLEGGSIESDGEGTLLTTSTCLLAPSRNPQLDRLALETELRHHLGAKRVLWLDQPALPGDDTDAHIDTLVRFCPNHTLVYVQGADGADPGDPWQGAGAGRDPLQQQLLALRTPEGKPYRLVPLPPGPSRQAPDDGRPLPTTYANALFLNGTVLMPVYGDPERDAAAEAAWRRACPGWRILPLDCSALVLQHGSLHCATMQLPAALFR
ncbi:MAG: agmatine deiminase family protein [Synechococcaceae cyanobacterium]